MRFSVIVPTYGRPERLSECLSALAALDYPTSEFEVLVVDDGGPVDLSPVTRRFAGRLNVRLLVETHQGPAAARNAGARAATGAWLVFTDDDCCPASDWLRRLEETGNLRAGVLLGGRTVNALEDRAASSASQLLIDYLYSYFNADPEAARFFASCNIAVPPDGFFAIGGFNTAFPGAAAEDRDLCDRWLQHGRRMAFVPDAVVLHRHALGLRSFWRQHAGYGRGAYRFHRARADRGGPPVSREPLAFYWRLVLYPFAVRARNPVQMSVLLFVSQVANALGFFREASRSRRAG